MRSRCRALLLSLALGLAAGGIGAQEPARPLPEGIAERAVEFFNAPSTIRFSGRSGVPAGGAIVGDVAVIGGPFTVGGRVQGDLLVVNGDLALLPGARVEGAVTVIGGRLERPDGSEVTGSVSVYPGPLGVVTREGQLALSARQLRALRREQGLGRTAFTVRAGTNYNRVEGLPVMFGPIFETPDPNSLKIEALAVWRSEAGLRLDSEEEFGYQLLVEQRFGRGRPYGVGATLHSLVNPIWALGLRDLESSLGTFFLHEDYRDYYEHFGWSAWARANLRSLPLALRLEFLDEAHRFAPVASPWTLRHNARAWRPQPLVAEGDLQALAGEAVFDTRNDARDPSDGWWVRARVTRSLTGSLAIPAHALEESDAPPLQLDARATPGSFTAGTLDLRRYARVGPDADVALRLLLGGALDRGPLPPQYQQALGGPGTLPGYALFSLDCGARSRLVSYERADGSVVPAFPAYGCDRSALFQLEYRGRLSRELRVRTGDDDRWDWVPDVDLSPSWAFFFDVGRGWSVSDPELDTPLTSDVGAGLFLGDVGLYLAHPLRGEDRGVRLLARIHRRF